jgi:hypothetical protein
VSKVKTLVSVSAHTDKLWSDLPPDIRRCVEWDLPRLTREWDRLSAQQRRDVVREMLAELEKELAFQVGFSEKATWADDSRRDDLFLVQSALEKLRASEAPGRTDGGAPGKRREGCADGIAIVRAVIDAIKTDGKQLKRKTFNNMVRELIKPRPRGTNLEELWRELALEEWREVGQGSPLPGVMIEDWKSYLPEK